MQVQSAKILLSVIFLLPVVILPQTPIESQVQRNETVDEIVRIDTNLINVPVSVLDRDGRLVSNLRATDFQIFEDGVEQEIAVFESTEQPFTVLLLLDVSGSMTPYLTDLTKSANAFIGELRPEDSIVAATFADNFHLVLKCTRFSDLKKRVKIRQRTGESYTRIYDAMHDAIWKMKKIRGRRAIILFSDGGGDGTFASKEDNFRHAEEDEVMIYTVQYQNVLQSPPHNANSKKFYSALKEADEYMLRLAELTGGRSFRLENIGDLTKVFGEIASELRQTYSLGYYSNVLKKTDAIRRIKVTVNVPNVAVNARREYRIVPSKD